MAPDGEDVVCALPTAIWFPRYALGGLPPERSSLLLFPMRPPHAFDSVVTDVNDNVIEVQLAESSARTCWVWGAVRFTASDFKAFHGFWKSHPESGESLGALLSAYVAGGGQLFGHRGGTTYFDAATTEGLQAASAALDAIES